MTDCRCLVVGLGNPLMGDDGVGPAVVARLSLVGLPPGLRAAEVGGDISRLPAFWDREPVIWLVDAIDLHRPPGSIHRIEHHELLDLEDHRSWAHQLAVPEQLRWLLHGVPDLAAARFTLWGVVPESIAPRPILTETASRAADQLAAEILSAWEICD